MKQILLDTSFILSCIRNKIDIFEKLLEYKIIIPKQVINEVKGISKSKLEARLALKIIEEKKNITVINLHGGSVDKKIINYAKENPEIIVATLDREMKLKIKNKKLMIKNRKKLEVI